MASLNMKSMIKYILILLYLVSFDISYPSITLNKKDAEVWYPEQTITGKVSGIETNQITVHYEDSTFLVSVNRDHNFSFQLTLRDKKNRIWAEVPFQEQSAIVISDTLDLTLGYTPTPVIKPTVTIEDEKAILKAEIIENPYHRSLSFVWMPDSLNPAKSKIQNKKKSTITVKIPNKLGHYFFNLLVISGRDSVWFQTMVTRRREGLQAFNIEKDAPYWMDKAIIYEITPYSFVKDGTFKAITAKLSELKRLGINTIWLQPVTLSYNKGQGYDVIDYFAVDPELGTERDLQHLITEAKDLGLRVLFDIVLNHTSIQHPYAENSIKYGKESHYYDYYQRNKDGKPYSSYYSINEHGFINYFWDELVNLNYKNKEVRRWMLEACKYWVRKYDIDGYRFDAIWGVNARMPSFGQRLRIELKSIKPDILLLAEDKGSNPIVFKQGFDAAYDWKADTSWISHWSWAYEYNSRKNLTIFNHPDHDKRGKMLRQALFGNEENAHRLLRFIGNNDLAPFIQDHALKQTKMAAALLFSIPGIPMLYSGQEIGKRGHPYSINAIFRRDSTIKSLDYLGLFNYYQKLIRIHKKYLALSGKEMNKLSVFPNEAISAFHRWAGDRHFVVIINMDNKDNTAVVDIRDISFDNNCCIYHLQDVLSGDVFEVQRDLSQIAIEMSAHSVRWLLLIEEQD